MLLRKPFANVLLANEEKPYCYPEEPPLLKQRASKDHVFRYTGIDYAGPIYIKNVYGSDFNTYKAWRYIFRCC